MKQGISSGLAMIVMAALVVLSQSLFVIREIDQAIVVQLGSPVGEAIRTPGLHWKLPFIQEVHIFDKRLLEFEQEPLEILSSDKKNLRVDSYARWRIMNPLRFYQTVRSEMGAADRMSDIIHSNLREVLGQYTMMEIVAGTRDDIMVLIKNQSNKQASEFGVEISDVRIMRTDLPPENSKAVYRRMQTERERQAKQYRAEGEEEAVKIRSRADREREVLLAAAYGQAQMLRGEGDATSARIYAEAYRKDPEFFEFLRTLDAYRKSFASDTTLVLEPSGFFGYFAAPPSVNAPGLR